jgi:CRISPR-associated protein Cas5h
MDTTVFENLKRAIIHRQSVYVPYLGKNDHMAVIDNPRVCESTLIRDVHEINSLYYEIPGIIFDDFADPPENSSFYYFEEMMPWKLDPKLNYYKFRTVCLTNKFIESIPRKSVFYKTEGKTLALL